MKLDVDALAQAIKWVAFIEASAGRLSPLAHAERVATIYQKIIDNGGKLPPDDAAEIIKNL